jgi:diguanylate cyclase (GGDEF)-like protein/PAS domain S-box-containing protein
MDKSKSDTTLFQTLAENTFDGLIQIDVKGRVVLWNQGAERILGYTSKEIVGQDYRKIFGVSPQDSTQVQHDANSSISKTLLDGEDREGLISLRHKGGYVMKLLARTITIRDDSGKISGAFKILNDNKTLIALHQEHKKTDETILLDSGTGIGNRAHIELKIRHMLAEFHTSEGAPIGILFMDIDKFKDFNDTYGHLVGDKVLRFVANTLRQNLRTSDSCGRWGGEEFVALVLDSNLEGLKKIAEKLRSLVESGGVTENGADLRTTISIGATMATDEDTLQSLLERADKLMYQSKEAGRNRVTVG